MAWRSARLNAILGASPEAVTFEQLEALTSNDAAGEAEELDFKRLYEPGDKGMEDIAVDIATFANHRGGVIVVGMAEANARPSAVTGVELTDALERRIHEVAASRTHPLPSFTLRAVPRPGYEGKLPSGLLLITVPPSAMAPHAVFTPSSRHNLRWPRRHGTAKIWMSESDLASAYRRRFAAAADQAERLTQISGEVVEGFPLPRRPGTGMASGRLTISLVPEVPGDLIVDRSSFDRFRADLQREPLLIGYEPPQTGWQPGVGRRRFTASSQDGRIEFHADGSASAVMSLYLEELEKTHVAVWDSAILVWTVSLLRYLGRHARDRAGASGVAAVTATLNGRYGENSSWFEVPVALLTVSHFGSGIDRLGTEQRRETSGRTDVLLDDLADGAQGLAAAVAALANDMFQSACTRPGPGAPAPLRRPGSSVGEGTRPRARRTCRG
ncbi:ATP-binding protein [Actinocorallia sp. A-T 12471]|uniref:AlbA family DNA-binding domain-containing protein n=1 Tax=Actinocorallia sp. A-T 12471 TaxID=3089813 RepID=UPI0029CE6B9F|nr:ATP-binding protein [Actinocorallia sp. A-T 12471]MDX6738150.1 ATP-binding protein [Actinocorallia sp. A-T 12471]